jgi:N-acetyl-gamma-glutamylphosphate reductase
VYAVPGLTPRSPLITVSPVLVTVVPPNTAKLSAVNSEVGASGGGEAANATGNGDAIIEAKIKTMRSFCFRVIELIIVFIIKIL